MDSPEGPPIMKPMLNTASPARIGDLVRSWRQRRRFSQLGLAAEAEISQRHLSFLESGKAMPSREMIMRIARHLEIPPRERNTLLVAAGFAPVYRERPLSDPTLAPVRQMIERVLRGYEPFPALTVDRHWTMLMANAALAPLVVGVAPHLLQPPLNVLRLSMHPEGLASRIINFSEWREHLLARLTSQLESSGDPALDVLRGELAAYPLPEGSRTGRARPDTALCDIAVPLELRAGDRVLRFLSTTTVFGTPLDVTLSELAIEAFLPADPETAEALRADDDLAGHRPGPPQALDQRAFPALSRGERTLGDFP